MMMVHPIDQSCRWRHLIALKALVLVVFYWNQQQSGKTTSGTRQSAYLLT
jgi:hypothetical protein